MFNFNLITQLHNDDNDDINPLLVCIYDNYNQNF